MLYIFWRSVVLVLKLAWESFKRPEQDDLRGDAWVPVGIRKDCMGKGCIVHMALGAFFMGTTVPSLRNGFLGAEKAPGGGLIGGYLTP